MARKKLHCPHCAGENAVDFDLTGIGNSERYHQLEDCGECRQPFVVTVLATYKWGVGTIEWQDDARTIEARGEEG